MFCYVTEDQQHESESPILKVLFLSAMVGVELLLCSLFIGLDNQGRSKVYRIFFSNPRMDTLKKHGLDLTLSLIFFHFAR